jgi:hypothetical protein
MATNMTGNGNSAAEQFDGGIGYWSARGTFSAGTAKLQHSVDGGANWLDVGADVTKTADGGGTFFLGPCLLRTNLAGAGSPNIDVTWRYVQR